MRSQLSVFSLLVAVPAVICAPAPAEAKLLKKSKKSVKKVSAKDIKNARNTWITQRAKN